MDENGQETSSYNFSSYGNQVEVALGRVTFVGMAGTCSIEAYADVDDANTRFGALTIEVEPGTEVEIDLDGPSLTVTFPPVDHVTSDAAITVTGFASDDVGVATVTVNGVPATLTPAGPAPLVNFSFPLALSLGANQNRHRGHGHGRPDRHRHADGVPRGGPLQHAAGGQLDRTVECAVGKHEELQLHGHRP